MAAAIILVQQDLRTVLGAMDREKLRNLPCLMVKRFSVVATGGSRNRQEQVVSHEFTPGFQEL